MGSYPRSWPPGAPRRDARWTPFARVDPTPLTLWPILCRRLGVAVSEAKNARMQRYIPDHGLHVSARGTLQPRRPAVVSHFCSQKQVEGVAEGVAVGVKLYPI